MEIGLRRSSLVFAWAGRLGVILALGALGSAAPLRADGTANPLLEKVVALEARVLEHAKAKAWAECVADAKGAVALHKELRPEGAKLAPADEALVKRVIDAMDLCFRSVKEDEQKRDVLEQMSLTGDPQIVRTVKPLLRQPPAREGGLLHLAAISAASKVPHADYVETLLDLVDNSKSMKAAGAALRAFATFGQIKSKRVKILQSLVKSVEKARPGVRPSRPEENLDPARSEETNRWLGLSPLIPGTLNGLTGQNFGSADVWFDVVRARSNLEALFIL